MAGKKRKFFRGDTYPLELTVTLDGAPLDITDATFVLTAKRAISDADADAAFQVEGVIVDGPAGLARIVVPKTATNDRTAYPDEGTTLVYDVEMTEKPSTAYPDGRRTTLEVGTIQVLADVSRTE